VKGDWPPAARKKAIAKAASAHRGPTTHDSLITNHESGFAKLAYATRFFFGVFKLSLRAAVRSITLVEGGALLGALIF
jgi:hypothetical protein